MSSSPFFDSDDYVDQFDHKVIPAYRWTVDVFAERLAKAGFTEVQRLQQQFPNRPDRKYAAIAARAVWPPYDGGSGALDGAAETQRTQADGSCQ